MVNEKQKREDLQNILSQQEYQAYYEDNRNIFQIWWDQLKGWLADLLSQWFSSLEAANGMATGILITVCVFLCILFIWIIYVIIRKVKRKRTVREKLFQSINQNNWTYTNHWNEAEKQEREENYHVAIRHLFLAILMYFHDKEWLEAKIWKTNWEYYDELVRVNRNRADLFYDLALIFEKVTYGEQTIGQQAYDAFRKEATKLLDMEHEQSNSNG